MHYDESLNCVFVLFCHLLDQRLHELVKIERWLKVDACAEKDRVRELNERVVVRLCPHVVNFP